MTDFVLVPGAGGIAWYWHLVVAGLERAGHRAIAVDLPGDDDAAGLPEYVDLVVQAAAGLDELVLVGGSLGGFTVAVAAHRLPVREIVLVNAMIPVPGERAADWGDAVGSSPARVQAAEAGGYGTDFDELTYFMHDVPAAVVAEGERHLRPESDTVFTAPAQFDSWPDVPVRVLVGADDRLFPADFQRRVARERLGIEADVRPGGHLIALANPDAVVDYLLAGP